MAVLDVSSRSPIFRGAVIVAAASLLMGVAGVFYFHGRESARRASHPPDAAAVLVRGLAAFDAVEPTAEWIGPSGDLHFETGSTGSRPGLWLFREAPEGRSLTLRVLHAVDGRTRVLHDQQAVLTRGAIFEVWLPHGR